MDVQHLISGITISCMLKIYYSFSLQQLSWRMIFCKCLFFIWITPLRKPSNDTAFLSPHWQCEKTFCMYSNMLQIKKENAFTVKSGYHMRWFIVIFLRLSENIKLCLWKLKTCLFLLRVVLVKVIKTNEWSAERTSDRSMENVGRWQQLKREFFQLILQTTNLLINYFFFPHWCLACEGIHRHFTLINKTLFSTSDENHQLFCTAKHCT